MKAFFPRLAEILGVPEKTLTERLARLSRAPRVQPVILKEDPSIAEAAYIESRRLELPMLSVEVESRRNYSTVRWRPTRSYVGEVSEIRQERPRRVRSGEIVGKRRRETITKTISRRKGWKQVVVNSLGVRSGDRGGRKAESWPAMRMTIDLDLQRALEQAYGDEADRRCSSIPIRGLPGDDLPRLDPNVFAHRFSRTPGKGSCGTPATSAGSRLPLQVAPGRLKIVMSIAALEGTPTPARGIIAQDRALRREGLPVLGRAQRRGTAT